MTKCQGCGSLLQSEQPTIVGYVPSSKLASALYCERCYKLTHYKQFRETAFTPANNEKIIKKINTDQAVVFFLVDFLNINNEIITVFNKIKSPKVLAISKYDIVPKSVKKNNLIAWLRAEYNLSESIEFVSSKTSFNCHLITRYLLNNNLKKAYVVGFTNAGKSTFINSIIKANKLTTSPIPNTTLDYIKIKIDDLTIIDCPGFSYQQAFYTKSSDAGKLVTKKALKPITFQNKPNQSYLIDQSLQISSPDYNSFTFYLPPNVILKRIYQSEIVNETVYDIKANSDLVIKTLGFINIKKATQIKINQEYADLIEIRNSCFSGESNE